MTLILVVEQEVMRATPRNSNSLRRNWRIRAGRPAKIFCSKVVHELVTVCGIRGRVFLFLLVLFVGFSFMVVCLEFLVLFFFLFVDNVSILTQNNCTSSIVYTINCMVS